MSKCLTNELNLTLDLPWLTMRIAKLNWQHYFWNVSGNRNLTVLSWQKSTFQAITAGLLHGIGFGNTRTFCSNCRLAFSTCTCREFLLHFHRLWMMNFPVWWFHPKKNRCGKIVDTSKRRRFSKLANAASFKWVGEKSHCSFSLQSNKSVHFTNYFLLAFNIQLSGNLGVFYKPKIKVLHQLLSTLSAARATHLTMSWYL